jgi:probable F420-dependent oxidoreductase
VKVGVNLLPEHTPMPALRDAWRVAEALGVDSLWIWDHFFPVTGDLEGTSFECWSLIAAMAADTHRATVGSLVSACGYRNPDLLADMARTVDHISGGRAALGIGAGWMGRDYEAYGYPFPPDRARLEELEQALIRVRARLASLRPPPVGPLPVLVGGSGERVTLRLVAQYADAWNCTVPLDEFARKNAVLDRWCDRVGRDPTSIERTISVFAEEAPLPLSHYEAAGAAHVIRSVRHPFDLADVAELLAQRG